MTLERTVMDTPLGPVFFVERQGKVCALGFTSEREHVAALERGLRRRFSGEQIVDVARSPTRDRLAAYLGGQIDALDHIAVDAEGTEFQRAVWDALRKIPAGATASYAEIARAVGKPAAVRAVGAANARNPVSLIVPCHRVVRSDGSLCGYAGGVDRKRWLLEHETRARR